MTGKPPGCPLVARCGMNVSPAVHVKKKISFVFGRSDVCSVFCFDPLFAAKTLDLSDITSSTWRRPNLRYFIIMMGGREDMVSILVYSQWFHTS